MVASIYIDINYFRINCSNLEIEIEKKEKYCVFVRLNALKVRIIIIGTRLN